MPISYLKKNLFVFTTVTFFAASTLLAGPGKSGGGDECENQLKEIKKDFLAWIDEGGHKQLDLLERMTHENYSEKMKSEILQSQFSCVGPADKGYPVEVNGTPKVCKFQKTSSQSVFKCDFNKFLLLSTEQKYRKYHHELAGLIGLEVPSSKKPEESTYEISNQISLESVLVKKVKLKVTRNSYAGITEKLRKLSARPDNESELAFKIRKDNTPEALNIIQSMSIKDLNKAMDSKKYEFKNNDFLYLSPLDIAVIMNNQSVLTALANRKPYDLYTGFLKAIELGKPSTIIDIFIQAGLDITTPHPGKSSLRHALESKQEKTFFYLIEKGADIYKDTSLKFLAAYYEQFSALNYLNSQKTDSSDRDLFYIIYNGKPTAAIKLFEMGADSKNALVAATAINSYFLTDYLLKKNLDPNKTEEFNLTDRFDRAEGWQVTLPLYNAILFNNLSIFERLIQAGADPHKHYLENFKSHRLTESEKSNDILYFTALNESYNIIDTVVRFRSDFNQLRSNGLAPIHAAVQGPYCTLKEEADSRVHCQTVKQNKIMMLKKLSQLRVDFNLPDSQGLRPLDHAQEEEIIELLIQLGADTKKITEDTKQRLKKMDFSF